MGQDFEGEPDGWVRAYGWGKPTRRRPDDGDATKEWIDD
jgi:hypothetical protein